MESKYGIVVNGDKVLSLSICVGNTVSPLFLPTSSELTYDQCAGMIHELARKTPKTAENSIDSAQHTHEAISLLEEVADTSSTEYAAHAQLISFKKRAMELIAKLHHE